MASISVSEMLRITALDVHPPLYYLLLKAWLIIGKSEYILRFLSVLSGILSIPLAYVVGKVWRGQQVGLIAALLSTFAPSLVYYSQVARMFGLSATLVLLATYGGLRLVHSLQADSRPSNFAALIFILGGTASLYTFYYTAPAIAALVLYMLFVGYQRLKTMMTYSATLGLAYMPWVIYAFPALWERVISRTTARESVDLALLFKQGFYSLFLAYGPAESLALVILFILLLGISAASVRSWFPLFLPTAMLLLTLLSVSLGTEAHMFAARYAISAVPAMALFLGWALASLLSRSGSLAVILLLLMAIPGLSSFTEYVYPKPLEVSGPFDPASDWRALREAGAKKDDLVFFNVLSLAGTYERFRTGEDPVWSYALRWDPVIEPLATAQERIENAAQSFPRVWFVLYKGTYAANYDLKYFLDTNFFPAYGQWRADTLYLLYLAPSGHWGELSLRARFRGGILLEETRFTSQVAAEGEFGVSMTWRAEAQLAGDYKVFVHLYDKEGRLIAQHDSFPVNDLRPTSSWQVGERIIDQHGIVLPEDAPTTLRLVVGMYDPESGERLLVNGADSLLIAEIAVGSGDIQD